MNRHSKAGWIAGLLLLGLTLCGCSDVTELLDEIPRDLTAVTAPKETQTESTQPAQDSLQEIQPAGDGTEESFLYDWSFRYAYSMLSDAEKLWYEDIEAILGSCRTEAALSTEPLSEGLAAEDIDRIFQCVLNDHPELFFVEGYSYTKYTKGEQTESISFSGTYNVQIDEAEEKMEQIEAAAEEVLVGISGTASDYDKVKYVYDAIIRSTDYEVDAPDNQNIYSVFVNHASVCQGYSKATQYLLGRLGVECALVLGTVETGEGHAWNLVKEDGEWYYVDTTWGDASYQLGEGDAETVAMPEINYDYLNVTTQELERTHTIHSEVPMPLCTSMQDNYYAREGALFEEYDKEQMKALFDGLQEGQSDVTVKCAGEDCYGQILEALIGQQEIFDYIPDAGGSVAYTQNDKQLSLTFWVTNE